MRLLPEQFGKRRGEAAGMVTAAFAAHFLSLAVPVLTLQVYDRILKYPHQGTLAVLVGGVVVAIVLEWAVKTARSAIATKREAAFEHGMQVALVERALGVVHGTAESRPASSRLQDVAAVASLKDRHGGETAAVLVELPFVAIFLGFIVYLTGWLVVVPLVLMALFAASALWFGAKLRTALAERESAEEERDAVMLEALETIHLIKAMTIERPFLRRYEAVQYKVGVGGLKTACWSGALSAFGGWCAQAMTIAVMAAGAPLVVSGGLTTGALVATILLSGRLMPPMQRALGLWTRAQEFALAEKRLAGSLGETQRDTRRYSPTVVTGALEVSELGFRWADDEPPLLADVSFALRAGESAHIAAEPGSGATSFLKLLAGIYVPSEGTVKIDGQEASEYPSEELAKHVAYLPSEGVIFRGTVFDNLSGFDPSRHDAAVEMAGLLGISSAVLRLPQGYETILEGGSADLIPPGLAQRISIARALLHKPRLILFDQADRALDKEGYNHVFKLLGKLKGKATLVIVSGDRNLAQFADHRLRLSQGTLLAERRSRTRPAVTLDEIAV